MPLIRRRLQAQANGQPGIDRSIVFVIGDVTAQERKRLRGIVFEATDKRDAAFRFMELRKLARQAIEAGEVAQFLNSLDHRGRFSPSATPLFDTFATEWKKTCVDGGGLRESQQKSDEQVLRCHLRPFFGTKHLGEIDAREVDRYKAHKKAQKHARFDGVYKAATINNHLSVLHRIFEKAIEYGLLEKNPVTRKSWVPPDTTPEDSLNWWTPEEEAKAFRVLRDDWRESKPRQYIAILTQLIVGLRFGELRALAKSDLDLNAPGLWIRRSMARKTLNTPKNKRARFQAIPRELADELKKWMLSTDGQLLIASANGKPLCNEIVNRWYARLAKQAGVRTITSHGARHTSGSSYAMSGVGQKVIARLLGHADTSATERYTHVQTAGTAPMVEARWARLESK